MVLVLPGLLRQPYLSFNTHSMRANFKFLIATKCSAMPTHIDARSRTLQKSRVELLCVDRRSLALRGCFGWRTLRPRCAQLAHFFQPLLFIIGADGDELDH